MIDRNDEQRIGKMIDDAVKKYAYDAQFRVVPIPYHVHTGVDSPQVDGMNLAGAVLGRTASYTSTATPTPPANSIDLFDITALSTTGAFQPPIGDAFDGSLLRIRITSSNASTARALTWSTATGGYIGTTPALPSTTTTGKTSHLLFEYDSSNNAKKWRLLLSAQS